MLTISFMWDETSLGRPLHLSKEDLDKGYGENDSELDRLFNEFYREIILENIDEEKESKIYIPLNYMEDLASTPLEEIGRSINSFITLYPIIRDTNHEPHIGSFSKKELETARDLFKPLSLRERRAWIILTDYLGNDRMKDILSKVFEESMKGKTSGEIADILGYS